MTTFTKQKIPLLDLNAQYESIENECLEAIKEVFQSKQFIMGPKVKALETEIAEYCNAKHAIGVSSGTDALVLSLMALGIGAGDEVITTPFTFFSTVGSIVRVGAKPVFVDIDPNTYNIDVSKLESAITLATKAIIPVHLFGQMADMKPINEIAKKHNVFVIEDGAQAIGSKYKGGMAGTFGDLGCFSFFPSKNLGACGDGGIVVTNDDNLAEKCRIMRVHGSKPKYYHHVVGGNFRLDPMQAAILSVKLPHLESQHQSRISNAVYYNEHLGDHVLKPTLDHYFESNNAESRMIYNQYTIRLADRDDFQAYLNDHTIGNAIYYPVPMHMQTCFKDLGYKQGDFIESEKAAAEVISIPIYPELNTNQLDYVVSVINAYNK